MLSCFKLRADMDARAAGSRGNPSRPSFRGNGRPSGPGALRGRGGFQGDLNSFEGLLIESPSAQPDAVAAVASLPPAPVPSHGR